MAFTDRFLKIPVKIYDVKENELTNKADYECEQLDTYRRLLPMQIESYGPTIPGSINFEEGNQIITTITMKSGETFLAFIECRQFEKLLNDFDK